MATKEAAALAVAVEEGKTRDLYNALRTGDLGVSLEALAQALYFLQHAEFTLFDMKDAFHSSTGANERFLTYREFQIALGKIAGVRYYGNCDGIEEMVGVSLDRDALPKHRPQPTELELMCLLVDQLIGKNHRHELGTLRCHMTRSSVLDTLEHNLPLLVQSFQLYGSQNRLSTNIPTSMMSTITLEGFIDFLNAYFEYEEFFSFSDLAVMSTEVISGFASARSESKESKEQLIDEEMNFAQFLELFCRVASAFHHKLLAQEGAQLRRAVESCRLEFSLEVLLDHMHITLIPNDNSNLASQHEITTQPSQSPRGDESVALIAIVQNVRDVLRLDAADQAMAKKPRNRLKREGSLVAQAQLPRRPSSNRSEQESSGKSTSIVHSTKLQHQPNAKQGPKPPPQVAMIREVVIPPTLPADVIHQLESALKFQNLGQYNMALSALDSCKQCYHQQLSKPTDDHICGILDPIEAEVHLFFALQAASIYDSAHRDAQALTKYYEAMKLARQLPASHPGRVLAKSCVGVTLFYAGELVLAQQCHQLVLDARISTKSSGVSMDASLTPDTRAAAKKDGFPTYVLVDTASAMNNLACCLSQDPSDSASKSLDSAYLLFKHAREIYADTFGPSHPRVGLISRNLDRVRVCQDGVVSNAAGALARGKYTHVIPGSTFQIKAFEYVANSSVKSNSSKGSKAGGKKNKKGTK